MVRRCGAASCYAPSASGTTLKTTPLLALLRHPWPDELLYAHMTSSPAADTRLVSMDRARRRSPCSVWHRGEAAGHDGGLRGQVE